MDPARIRLNQGAQTAAYESKATEILYGGAAGGAKSFLLRTLGLSWCLAVEGFQCYLFRRTHPQLIKNHLTGNQNLLEMAYPWTRAKVAKWNWQRHALEFTNGSNLFLCHSKNEFDVYDYLGAEIHGLLIDELTTFTSFQYRFLRSRLRAVGITVPADCHWHFPMAVSGSNPGNIGHNWVKAAFVDFAPAYELRQAPASEGGMVRQYIPAKLADNFAMSEAEKREYAMVLQGLGNPALVKAMLEGSWDIVAGGMFDDVWDLEWNTCEPFDIPRGWPITRSFDWGSSKPFSVGWWTESNGEEVTMRDGTKRTWPKGHRFRILEWYGWNSKENGGYHETGEPNVGCKMDEADIAKGIKRMEHDAGWQGRVKPGAADASIWDTDRGTSIADTMKAHGVMFLKADKSPGSRKNGWALMRRMMKASHQVPQEEPGVTVFNTCKHFVRTIPVLPRDEKNSDDVNSDSEDHVADESRYELARKVSKATRIQIKGA